MVLSTTQRDAKATSVERPTVEALLAEQQDLTAVERFASNHVASDTPLQERYYRDLIPLSLPVDGQQYAFEVDLDKCSGCKACVSACHHLNGLEESETWRSVGQLHGAAQGVEQSIPVLQHVTTACHHCLEPGCLTGCPTNAYEKDAVTGIVRHLDDQCFGCQYCTMACPYEVPQYSSAKGIVRKCDMCADRLSSGEAPACVQACPSQAIRISIVDKQEVSRRAGVNDFLPGSPDSAITQPATLYRRRKRLPETLEAASEPFASPQHPHLPLVGTLVLTQMGVGTVVLMSLMRSLGEVNIPASIALGNAIGLVAFLAGLAVAPLHLGRPYLFFRGVLGWRHSWLSREAIAFGIAFPFMVLALMFACGNVESWAVLPLEVPKSIQLSTEALCGIVGIAGVFCSARIYQFCKRDYWQGSRTGLKFTMTAVLLGLATAVFASSVTGDAVKPDVASALTLLLTLLIVGSTVQLAYELAVLRFSNQVDTSLRLSARLLLGDLRFMTAARVLTTMIGGIALPAALLLGRGQLDPTTTSILAGAALISCLLGELAARYLYFAAVIPLRMPGGVG